MQYNIANLPESIMRKELKKKKNLHSTGFSMGFSIWERAVASPWRALPTDSTLVLACKPLQLCQGFSLVNSLD